MKSITRLISQAQQQAMEARWAINDAEQYSDNPLQVLRECATALDHLSEVDNLLERLSDAIEQVARISEARG